MWIKNNNVKKCERGFWWYQFFNRYRKVLYLGVKQGSGKSQPTGLTKHQLFFFESHLSNMQTRRMGYIPSSPPLSYIYYNWRWYLPKKGNSLLIRLGTSVSYFFQFFQMPII